LRSAISHWVHINNDKLTKNNISLADNAFAQPEDHYRHFQYNYPKFFKMDSLCKWAWLGAETLLTGNGAQVYEGTDKTRIAVVLMTGNGCLDVDKRFNETTATIASPALFVYTLPNIMLGEISIRHGFKGEQTCFVSEHFDTEEIFFCVNDLLQNRNTDACICGWVDVVNGNKDICLYWITKNSKGMEFSAANLSQLYKSQMNGA
jgi:hypothetical protein